MPREPRWNRRLIDEAAAPYSSRSEFAEKNKPAYEAARLIGVLDQLFPLLLNQWDERAVRREARRYSSRTEFARGSGAAYNAARRLGILASIFKSKLESWTIDKIEVVASGCGNKKDFKRKNATAYNAALRLGVIDRLFDNQGRVKARDCVYLWSVQGEPGLYKVGVTSDDMGHYRIEQVAKEAGFVPVLILLEQVGYEMAKQIEKRMKKIGVPYTHPRQFYGRTEFRYMTPAQVGQCVEIVKTYRLSRGV